MASIKDQIILEMAHAMQILGAQSDLLSIVGSFGDELALNDEQILVALKEWNGIHENPAIHP